MADFPLRNILVPAVLVGSTVFSVLTLPVLSLRPTSVALNLPAFLGGDLRYSIFERGNKNLTIRYIGFVIIASAGSGIATAELVRKWHAQMEKKQVRQQQRSEQMKPHVPTSAEQSFEQELEPEEVTLAAVDAAFSSPAAFDGNTATYFANSFTATLLPEAAEFDRVEDFDFHLRATADADRAIAAEHSGLVAQLAEPILDLFSCYQPCHIQVPHSEHRLFAIYVEGDFYSLLRLTKTKEKSIEIARHMRTAGSQVVITETHQGYATWNWEPEAQLLVE